MVAAPDLDVLPSAFDENVELKICLKRATTEFAEPIEQSTEDFFKCSVPFQFLQCPRGVMVASGPVWTLCERDCLERGAVMAHFRLVQQVHNAVDGSVETNDVVLIASARLEPQSFANAVLVE